MKITFIFTNTPDLASVPRDERFSSSFDIPDITRDLPDLKLQILKIAELVGKLTLANVHVHCPEIGLKNYPIKQLEESSEQGYSLFHTVGRLCLYFHAILSRRTGVKTAKR